MAAQLAGLTVAAKATIGIGVATAAIGTVSVVGIVPVPGVDSGGSRPGAEVQLPSVPTAEADLGLQTANDAAAPPPASPRPPASTGPPRPPRLSTCPRSCPARPRVSR